jgi:FkbM family methyltransferase
MINIPLHNLGLYTIPEECKKYTCVDIGANIGDFVMKAKDIFETVHFYEPYKPCFDVIQSKIHNLDITGFNEAVYCKDGEQLQMTSHQNRDAGSNALMTEILNDHWDLPLNNVTTVSLPTILKRVGGRINYLKCDCENSEYFLFMNQDLSGIDYIGLELHWQMGESRFNELVNHLQKTHISDQYFPWIEESNYELLFRNKNI